MKASKEELITILDTVTSTLGELLATTVEIQEGKETDARQRQALKANVAKIKAEMEKAKAKLERQKLVTDRKKELEKANKGTDKKPSIQEASKEAKWITHRYSGDVIAKEYQDGNGTSYFYGTDGGLLAKERNGATYNAKGRLVSKTRLGMVIVGIHMVDNHLKEMRRRNEAKYCGSN